MTDSESNDKPIVKNRKPYSDRPIRFVKAGGETFEEMQKRVRSTPLSECGDAILVWVNEGDFWMSNPQDCTFSRYITESDAVRALDVLVYPGKTVRDLIREYLIASAEPSGFPYPHWIDDTKKVLIEAGFFSAGWGDKGIKDAMRDLIKGALK